MSDETRHNVASWVRGGAYGAIVSVVGAIAFLTMPQWLFDEGDERPNGLMGWLYDRWKGDQ